MKIIINKRYIDEKLHFGKILKSELTFTFPEKKFEYCREYIPLDVETPTINDKKTYKIEGRLDISEYKSNLLLEHLTRITDNPVDINLSNNKNNILEYLSYIDLTIDGQKYIIKINSLDYELLIHLSTYEFFDNHEIDYISENILPIPKEDI